MTILFMMCGLPGSGKTTQIKNILIEAPTAILLSTDAFLEQKSKELNISYNDVFYSYIKDADKKMKSDLAYAIENNLPVIWDQTNLNEKVRRKHLRNFPNSYKKVAVVCLSDFDDIIDTNIERRKYGRSLPPHILDSMIETFQIPYQEEGFDELRIYHKYK